MNEHAAHSQNFQHAGADPHAHHRISPWTKLVLTGALVSAGFILAPHILPAIGIGNSELAENALQMLHPYINGSGIAGMVNGVIKAIPLVGETLATNGLANALTTGVIGIGGVLLGNYIEKKEDGKTSIKWGNIIKTAALATSFFLALPTVLTGISMGLIYLGEAAVDAGLIEAVTASNMYGVIAETLGTIGGSVHSAMMGAGGLLATLPHLLTCGISLLPAAISWKLSDNTNEEKTTNFTQDKTQFANRALKPSSFVERENSNHSHASAHAM
jgi:hypothetical protein